MPICNFCNEDCSERIRVENTETQSVICSDCVFEMAETMAEMMNNNTCEKAQYDA